MFRPTRADQARRTTVQAPADARLTDATRRIDAGNVVDVAFVHPAALVSKYESETLQSKKLRVRR